MTYTYIEQELIEQKEFLLEELHRFHRENGRVPRQINMQPKFGYPSYGSYIYHFGSWNNALEAAGFEISKKQHVGILDGTEICSHCGRRADEIEGFRQWHYNSNIRYCNKCGRSEGLHDYKNGKLNKESSTGKATISEQVVKNVLNLEERYDCNFACGFGYPIDLYHKEKYKCINVKDAVLYKDNSWGFHLTQKVTPDTYIMLGYDEDRKNILHVWITDAVDDLVFNEKTGTLLKKKTITNSYESLKRAKPWEVDAKPYNDMLHKMSQKRKETNGKECFLSNNDLGV